MVIVFIKYIIYFSIIVYIFSYFYLKFTHPFWFSQPVSQYTNLFTSDGIISKNVPKPINVNGFNVEYVDTKDKNNLIKIRDLLNNNYNINDNYKFKYDIDYLNWTINTPFLHYNIKANHNWGSFGIFNNKELIGYINGKPIEIRLDSNILPAFYSDYLCVDKKFRKQKLVQSLISNIAYTSFIGDFKIYAFRKELYSLPFNYITKYNYYLINGKSIDKNSKNYIEKVNKNELNFTLLYTFYIKHVEKCKLYNRLYYNEFIHYINNDNVTLYKNIGKDISILIGIFDTKIITTESKNNADFLFIFIDDKNIFTSVIDEFIFKESNNYNNFFITNTMDNYIYINEKKLEKDSTIFLHFYNYSYKKQIEPQDISLILP